MKKLLALLMVLVAAGCGSEEVVIPENGADLPEAQYLPSTLKAELDAEKKIALMTVNEAVQGYRLLSAEKRYPANLTKLVEGGMLPSLPELPEGLSFSYDVETGKVGIEGEEPAEVEEAEETEG